MNNNNNNINEPLKEETQDSNEKPLKFTVIKKCCSTKARVSRLELRHNRDPDFQTPVFMPVGTQGTMKGITSQQLKELKCHIILGNTYHLGHRPGHDLLDKMGGLHSFMNWPNGLLTDSGGFQMVSLLKLASITEEGVTFTSPHNGTQMLLTPEHSIGIQNQIGADIMMQLDDVVSSLTTGPRVEEAMKRSVRWLDRCVQAHGRPQDQSLFAIVQGGLDEELRKVSCAELIKRDLPGYAIGGLSGGEEKDKFWRMVTLCTDLLPENKPRYLMGVGYAVDLVICSALGVDMFDCVFPTRTARFGTALVRTGSLKVIAAEMKNDYRPLESDCDCMVCRKFSRAYLYSVAQQQTGQQLLTYHNLAYQMRLMREVREAVMEDRFGQYIRQFMLDQFPKKDYPQWALNALNSLKIQLF